MAIVDEINRIKTNIANAYDKAEEKGAVLPEIKNSDNLPEVIESITSGSSEDWQPEPDWWDIEKILEEDEEDYPAKMIMLVPNNIDKHTIPFCNANKVKMSDGAIYTSAETHTWDTSKDKPCSLGYKTRYIIFYYNNSNVGNISSIPANVNVYPLYIIHKNMNFTLSNGNSIYGSNIILECIKMINSSRFDDVIKYSTNLFSLQKIDNFDCPNITSARAMFYGASQLPLKYINIYLNKIDWSKITDCAYCFCQTRTIEILHNNFKTTNIQNFQNAFENSNIKIIEELDFLNATNVTNAFNSSLIIINKISNIKINGFNFRNCVLLTHDTLIKILEALYDYSEGETHTITLGSTNLAKLTPEELAIGQNKNWTIS